MELITTPARWSSIAWVDCGCSLRCRLMLAFCHSRNLTFGWEWPTREQPRP
jgi:hypothetical protein